MISFRRRPPPKHRIERARRVPLVTIAAGVGLVALCFPLAKALSGGPALRASFSRDPLPPRASLPTVVPLVSTIPLAPPGVRIQVVPGLRDVEFRIGGAVYATDPNGVIEVPEARGRVAVAYLGYSVTPALQQVSFRSWSDGATALTRAVDADGRGHIGAAVDLRYRVTVREVRSSQPAPPGGLTASTLYGPVTFANGTGQWVLAERGEGSGPGLKARRVAYTFWPVGPRKAQRFNPSPEAVWVVRAG